MSEGYIGLAKGASSSMEMSGHGLEEGSREENVAVLDEDGENSKSERLRLKAMMCVPGMPTWLPSSSNIESPLYVRIWELMMGTWNANACHTRAKMIGSV